MFANDDDYVSEDESFVKTEPNDHIDGLQPAAVVATKLEPVSEDELDYNVNDRVIECGENATCQNTSNLLPIIPEPRESYEYSSCPPIKVEQEESYLAAEEYYANRAREKEAPAWHLEDRREGYFVNPGCNWEEPVENQQPRCEGYPPNPGYSWEGLAQNGSMLPEGYQTYPESNWQGLLEYQRRGREEYLYRREGPMGWAERCEGYSTNSGYDRRWPAGIWDCHRVVTHPKVRLELPAAYPAKRRRQNSPEDRETRVKIEPGVNDSAEFSERYSANIPVKIENEDSDCDLRAEEYYASRGSAWEGPTESSGVRDEGYWVNRGANWEGPAGRHKPRSGEESAYRGGIREEPEANRKENEFTWEGPAAIQEEPVANWEEPASNREECNENQSANEKVAGNSALGCEGHSLVAGRCGQCGLDLSSYSKRSRARHKREHDYIRCVYCNAVFNGPSTVRQIRRHLTIDHLDEKEDEMTDLDFSWREYYKCRLESEEEKMNTNCEVCRAEVERNRKNFVNLLKQYLMKCEFKREKKMRKLAAKIKKQKRD